MNILDIILGIFLLVFFFYGFKKGLIASLIHLLGLIVAIFLIIKTGTVVKESMIEKFGFGDTLAMILSYLLIFIIIMIIAKIIILLLHKLIDVLNLTALNRILGGIFGVFNCFLVIAIILVILELSPLKNTVVNLTENSHIVKSTRILIGELEKNYPKIEQEKEKIQGILDKKKQP